MADILIKNMEMPKSCEECPLFYEYYSKLEGKSVLHCRARGEGESRFSDDFDWRTKPTYEEGCPLVAVEEAKINVTYPPEAQIFVEATSDNN